MSNSPEAAGHQSATGRFERLFRAHHSAVVGYVRRRAAAEAVDDLVEETFLVAWRRLDQIPAAELPWLLGVARRVLATHRRGARRRHALALRLGQSSLSSEAAATTGPDIPDLHLRAALSRLSAKDREALTLVAWDGLSPQQASQVLGDSPAAFRVRLHRARRRLRRLLDESPEPGAPEARFHIQESANG